MSTPVAPGVVSLEAVWLQENEIVENTFHYTGLSTTTVEQLTAVANVYYEWAGDKSILFHAACQLQKMVVRDLSSPTGTSVEVSASPPIDGTGEGGALPNNVTFSLKRETGMRGRANRGRIYLIGIPLSAVAAGAQQLDAVFAGSCVDAYNSLKANMLSEQSAQEVLLHKALGTNTPITTYGFADLNLDSQRRRLPGHNRHR